MNTSLKRRSVTMLHKFLVIALFFVVHLSAMAQERVVSGRVTDQAEGQPLPGVNVLIKGTNMGTVTDLDGKYSLPLMETASVLSFSYIGYQSAQVSIDQKTVVDVQLATDIVLLSEIVVTGTGVPTEKRNLAFAVESVSAKELPIVPAASIDQALLGRIPGGQLSSVNGTPGSEISILLRGINTINRGTQPIIMVDGVQMGATTISALDPNTIEKIEVIQGAAASTIYGAQGANGVIQVFTKKGVQGKVHVDISFNAGESTILNIGEVRKAKFHGFETNYKNEVTVAGDTTKLLSLDPSTLLYNGNIGFNYFNPSSQWNKPYDQNLTYNDHFAFFFKPARFYSSSVAVSGGSSKIDYNLAVSRIHQESTYREQGYNNRTNIVVNLGADLYRGLKLRSITQLIENRNSIPVYDRQDFSGNTSSPLNGLFQTAPFADYTLKDTDGNYGLHYGLAAGINQFNPLYERQYSSTLDNKLDVMQTLSLTYSLPRFAEFEVLYGINYQDRKLKLEVQNQSLNNNSVASNRWLWWNNFNDKTGEITSNYNERTFQNFKATATIKFDLIKDFNITTPIRSTTQIAFDYRSDNLQRLEMYALGMPVNPPLSSIRGTDFGVFQDYIEEFVTFGYLVNERVDYKDLGGFSAGFRSDYSSAFGAGSKPFIFPRADAYFRVSGLNVWNESGISSTILEWKLRAAYGQAGIQPRPFDRYLTLESKPIGTSNSLYIGANQSNPNLDVEVSEEFEAGTDIYIDGLDGNWLTDFQLSFTYWTRNSDNSIYNVIQPPSTGISSRLDNAIGLESHGLITSLHANVKKGSAFKWSLTANLSRQISTVSYVQTDQIIVGNRIIKAGSSVGEFYGYLMLHGVDEKKESGDPFIDPSIQSNYEVASNGWVVDRQTKRPYITSERYTMGNPNPDFMMSLINDFTYKDFITASIQFDGVAGSKLYNNTKQWMYRDAIHSDYEKPITINGETGAWSAFYQGVYNPTYWDKNYFVEDASFIRLRNVSIGLDFARLFSLKGFERLQFVVTGRNLLTITNYTGMDPEIGTYNIAENNYSNFAWAQFNSLNRGIDNASLPNSRSYQVTLNIGF